MGSSCLGCCCASIAALFVFVVEEIEDAELQGVLEQEEGSEEWATCEEHERLQVPVGVQNSVRCFIDQFLLLFQVVLHEFVNDEFLLLERALLFFPPVVLVVERDRQLVHVLVNVVVDAQVKLPLSRFVLAVD